MRAIIAGIAALIATSAGADEWVTMSGDEISDLLTGQTVTYELAWQEFRANGRTLYNAGSDSWGYWRVEGDKYCSQWPPRSEWACYVVEGNGAAIRFVGSAAGDVTVGHLSNSQP